MKKRIFKIEFEDALKSKDLKFLEGILKRLSRELSPKELSSIINDTLDMDGNSALHLAAINGEKDLTALLVKYGAQIDQKNDAERTALEEAELSNATRLGKALNALTFGYTDYKDTSKTQSFIKETTKSISKIQSMARGMKHKANLKEAIALKEIFLNAITDYRSPNKNSLVGTILAIQERFGAERTASILNQPTDKNKNTALHLAAASGDTDLAKLLIEFGANPNVKNKQGYTPKETAIKNQRSILGKIANYPDTTAVQEYLANPEKTENISPVNKSSFHEAVKTLIHYYEFNANNKSSKNDSEVIQALLKLQNFSKTKDFQNNPLDYLDPKTLLQLEKVVLAQNDAKSPLYQKGASGWINYYDHDKFIINAINSTKAIIQAKDDFDLKLKQKIALTDFKRAFQFYQTSKEKDVKKIEIILKRLDNTTKEYVLGESVDAKGNTALHIAALNGDLFLAKSLVSNGANIFAENFKKETPEILAKKNQRSFIGWLANYPDTAPVKDYLSQIPATKKLTVRSK